MSQKVLVTGAKGCIGAWVVRELLQQGYHPVALDLAGNMHRLQLVVGNALSRVTLIEGDICDQTALVNIMKAHDIRHIIHLAALQVPAARANPVRGAQVNIIGTVNIFEAAKAVNIPHIAYASSIAVFDPALQPVPQTLYGVWKLANEGTAQIYHQDHGISSIGLRPYVVYGLGRDFGVTSAPTAAMLAAAAQKPAHIPFAGTVLYHYAHDIARMFVKSALVTGFSRATAFNPPGTWANTQAIIDAIHAAAPDAAITTGDDTLPFPSHYPTDTLQNAIGEITLTPLETGVAKTVNDFRSALENGKITVQ